MAALPIIILNIYIYIIIFRKKTSAHLWIKDPDSVEEPVGHGQQECERGEEGTVYTHPGQTGSPRSEEQGPNGHQQHEELEGDGEEKTLTGRTARLQSVRPHHSRKKQEDQRRGQHQQAHTQTHS